MWIAFKNYYLRDEEQLVFFVLYNHVCCELLSKIIIFVTRNNGNYGDINHTQVVNCFQKLLSSWRGTTSFVKIIFNLLLWIAFKNYYLRDEEQQKNTKEELVCSCELLSKIIIFVTRNNTLFYRSLFNFVVNCFQKLLSSWRGTTRIFISHGLKKLWIAFKNYYLRDEEQQIKNLSPNSNRCELLSKIIIFVTRNNISTWSLLIIMYNTLEKLDHYLSWNY